MKVEIIDPFTGADWDDSVGQFACAQIFHRSAWARVLAESYGHRPCYLRFTNAGEIQALVPLMEVASRFTGRRAVSLPFADVAPPLLRDEAVRTAVLEELKRLAAARNWSHFELRGGGSPEPTAAPAASYHGHRIALPVDAGEFYKGLPGNVRRRVQRGTRADLKIEITRDLDALWDFYGLLSETRRRHGVPPQPRSFFALLHAHIIAAGLGTIILARNGACPVAGIVLLHCSGKAVYKFAASSDRAADAFPGVNNTVLWEAIRWLIQEGMRELHLGRTSLHNEGLRRFKAGWGAVEEPIDYFRFSRRFRRWTAGTDRSHGAHNALFSRMPPALNRLLGTFLYPHLD
jgi:hypothetical protein